MNLDEVIKQLIKEELLNRANNDMGNMEIVASISREETLKELLVLAYEDRFLNKQSIKAFLDKL